MWRKSSRKSPWCHGALENNSRGFYGAQVRHVFGYGQLTWVSEPQYIHQQQVGRLVNGTYCQENLFPLRRDVAPFTWIHRSKHPLHTPHLQGLRIPSRLSLFPARVWWRSRRPVADDANAPTSPSGSKAVERVMVASIAIIVVVIHIYYWMF